MPATDLRPGLAPPAVAAAVAVLAAAAAAGIDERWYVPVLLPDSGGLAAGGPMQSASAAVPRLDTAVRAGLLLVGRGGCAMAGAAAAVQVSHQTNVKSGQQHWLATM
jgi:hypothetical protein